MADYKMEPCTYKLNYKGAKFAREAFNEVTVKDLSKPCFVVGTLGPTNCTRSISLSVKDPAARNVTFDKLVETYFE